MATQAEVKTKRRSIHVKWNHIDGPMMSRPDGTLKWLTRRERFMHWIGAWSSADIAERR